MTSKRDVWVPNGDGGETLIDSETRQRTPVIRRPLLVERTTVADIPWLTFPRERAYADSLGIPLD